MKRKLLTSSCVGIVTAGMLFSGSLAVHADGPNVETVTSAEVNKLTIEEMLNLSFEKMQSETFRTCFSRKIDCRSYAFIARWIQKHPSEIEKHKFLTEILPAGVMCSLFMKESIVFKEHLVKNMNFQCFARNFHFAYTDGRVIYASYLAEKMKDEEFEKMLNQFSENLEQGIDLAKQIDQKHAALFKNRNGLSSKRSDCLEEFAKKYSKPVEELMVEHLLKKGVSVEKIQRDFAHLSAEIGGKGVFYRGNPERAFGSYIDGYLMQKEFQDRFVSCLSAKQAGSAGIEALFQYYHQGQGLTCEELLCFITHWRQMPAYRMDIVASYDFENYVMKAQKQAEMAAYLQVCKENGYTCTSVLSFIEENKNSVDWKRTFIADPEFETYVRQKAKEETRKQQEMETLYQHYSTQGNSAAEILIQINYYKETKEYADHLLMDPEFEAYVKQKVDAGK